MERYKNIKTILTITIFFLGAIYFFLLTGESRSFTVESVPSGGSVTLDGTLIGLTPIYIDKIISGKHTIKISLDKHEDYTTNFDTSEGVQTKILAKLLSLYGSLSINSKPDGANVLLDNKEIGKTPLKLQEIKKGKHKITLTLPKHLNFNKEFILSSSEHKIIDAKLIYACGDIFIDSTPSGGAIYLDGVRVGNAPLTLKDQIQGNHKLIIKLNLFKDYSDDILVSANSTTTINARLDTQQRVNFAIPRKHFPNGNYIYFLSHEKYLSPSNFMDSIKVRYGKGVELVEWEEIKKKFSKNLPNFLNKVGLTPHKSALVLCKGKINYAPNRGYFIARLQGYKPNNFQVHDELNNFYLALSSWKTRNQALLKVPRY